MKDIEANTSLVDEPQNSSTKLTLQKLNKEVEKKEAGAEAMRSRCKTCFRETAPKPKCNGHGGGGGGGGGDSASGATESQGAGNSLTEKPEDELANDVSSVGYGELPDAESQLEEQRFDPAIIADLISKELLIVDNDRQSMTLSINLNNLKCEPSSLSNQQRIELKRFMKAILKEFNEFKVENDLSDNCLTFTQDEDGNILSLRISLPTLVLYDAFIQRLANNLLPKPTPELQTENGVEQSQSSVSSPLSTKPRFIKDNDSKKNEAEHDDNKAAEDEVPFHPSPLSTKRE